MTAIFWRSIKDRRISLIVYMAAALLFMWMYVAMFPSIAAQAESFTALIESFPPAVFEAFGIEDLNMSTIESFLSVEHFSLVLPIMLIFMLTSVAGRALAGEIELGTVELLIARPVSRLKLFVARYAAGMGILITFTVISVFTIIPLAGLHGVEYLSFFHYYAYSDALVNQSLYGTGCLVFVCISRNVRRISVE